MSLANAKRNCHLTASANGSPLAEPRMANFCAVSNAIEGAEDAKQAKLIKDSKQPLSRLKKRFKGHLGKPISTDRKEPLLFDETDENSFEVEAAITPPPLSPRFPESFLRVYAQDFADHALRHLPQAVNYHSVEEFRNYLAEKLRFNSQPTRRRTANYIASRFFPGYVYSDDLPPFAAATAGKPALGDALFYLTCRTEKIVSLVAEDVVFPSLAQGGVSRTRIREYVLSKFPQSKSVSKIAQAIIRNYKFYGLGKANQTRLNVSLREGSMASFAYILHLEFPEPGMHGFDKIFNGPMHKWLLWDQQWMVRQLYRLREAGLLSKVSEIDRIRQFTTKFTLAQAVQPIVALAKESPQ
jgi:hypothetical protein